MEMYGAIWLYEEKRNLPFLLTGTSKLLFFLLLSLLSHTLIYILYVNYPLLNQLYLFFLKVVLVHVIIYFREKYVYLFCDNE